MWSSNWSHRLSSAAYVLLIGAAVGCGNEKAPEPVASAPAPVDAVDPEALPEGTLELFSIRFPARSAAISTMSDYAVVKVPYEAEKVSNYLKQRIDAASVDVGPTTTVYSGVVPKGSLGSVGVMTVIVKRQTFSAEVILRVDVPPARAADTRPRNPEPTALPKVPRPARSVRQVSD